MSVSNGTFAEITQIINLPSFVNAVLVFQGECVSTCAEVDFFAACKEYVTAVANAIRPSQKTTIRWADIRVVLPDEAREVGSDFLNIYGTATADLLPHGVAGLIMGLTANIKHRGRKYLPGMTEASIGADGLWAGTVWTNLNNAAAAYISPAPAGGPYLFNPGVRDRGTLVFRPFTAARASQTPAYQRRRRPTVT